MKTPILLLVAVSCLCASRAHAKTWIDDTGEYRVEAEFVEVKDDPAKVAPVEAAPPSSETTQAPAAPVEPSAEAPTAQGPGGGASPVRRQGEAERPALTALRLLRDAIWLLVLAVSLAGLAVRWLKRAMSGDAKIRSSFDVFKRRGSSLFSDGEMLWLAEIVNKRTASEYLLLELGIRRHEVKPTSIVSFLERLKSSRLLGLPGCTLDSSSPEMRARSSSAVTTCQRPSGYGTYHRW